MGGRSRLVTEDNDMSEEEDYPYHEESGHIQPSEEVEDGLVDQ